jgi:hypothetical protein
MVTGASDIDSSSCYTSSSSSDDEEEVDWHKSKRSSKNINGMCFATQGFCGMAHSSESKKSQNDDSNSNSENEVNNDLAFLIAENARCLEAALKTPLTTSCSTCELNAIQNLQLAHYVDRLQDENDDQRKMIGWLSGHEPQLRMMIKAYKRYDGQALGSDKIGGGSGEKEEKISDILALPKTFHKNTFVPSQTHLGID